MRIGNRGAAIKRRLQEPLALEILSGDFHEGEVIRADRDGEALVFFAAVQGEVGDPSFGKYYTPPILFFGIGGARNDTRVIL